MRLSAAETATFLALIGFAWNVKPLYGLTSDLVPLLGYRRRSYLLVTTAMAALGWLALGLLPGVSLGPRRSRSSGSRASGSRSPTSSATR